VEQSVILAILNPIRVATLSLAIGAMSTLDCLAEASAANSLPSKSATAALPAGVTELQFSDFFNMPIGPRGLEPSEKLLSLKDKRVRIAGYMVQEEDPKPGLFMLSSRTVSLSDIEDGPADDLPATTITVHLNPNAATTLVTYRPGLWTLTGTLQLGNQEERNGRISYARLLLDLPTKQINTPIKRDSDAAQNKIKAASNRSKQQDADKQQVAKQQPAVQQPTVQQ
jgi:hypothetical protein